MATSNNSASISTVSAASIVTVSSTVSTITTSLNTMNVITLSATVSSIVRVLARAFRPAVATRASLKAASRAAMARASRHANRVSKARRTQSARAIGPVVSRAYRLARIAAKAARRAGSTQLVITVGMVHGCALPKPSMKAAPLGGNSLPDGFRLVHRAARTGAPANAIKSVERTAPATARPGSGKVSVVATVSATPRLKDRAVVTAAPVEAVTSFFVVEGVDAQISSLRAGLENLVIAGPTGNDYGWSYISIEELAASIYDEEVTSPVTAHTIKADHPMYDMVVCGLGVNPQPVVGQAAASTQTSNNNSMLVPPQNTKVIYVNKVPMFPAKAFTKHNYPTPADFYAMETGRVAYKSVNDKGTYTFIGEEGTFNLMQNTKNGSVFMKNSHIRAFKIDGETRSFIDFMQKSLDKSVEEANNEFFAMVELLQTEGGLEADEAYESVVGQLGQPKKYIVLESIGTKNAQGVYEYAYDMESITTMENKYVAMGYQVLGIQSSLLLSSMTIANFRLDGNAPCTPVTTADLRALNVLGITEWNASNIHMSVKAVTDLQVWLKEVMPNVKAMSFSFNGITLPTERTSVVTGNESTVHEYSLTTDPERYSDFSITEGSVPAWTINLWTATPVAKSITTQSDTLAIAKEARVFESKSGAGKTPTKSAISLLMQKQQMQNKKVAQAGLGVRPAAVPAAMRVTTAMETVPAAMDQDTTSGANAADDLEELSSVPLTATVTAAAVERNAVKEMGTTNIGQAVTDKLSSLSSFSDDDLCQLITLKDINMASNTLSALINLSVELGISIKVLAGSNDLGMYSNGVIYIVEGLSDNHRAQVLLHELVHAVFSSMDQEVVAAICEDWLTVVGQSAATPAGVSVEEQFAYSFMEHAHNVDTLISFLTGAITGTPGWEVMFNELEEVAAASKVVVSAAPIAIVGAGEVVATAPKTNAVLEALLEVTNKSLLVLTDAKGTLPAVYTTAFPELVVPEVELGDVVSMITEAGLKVYAICGVTEQATLSIEALKMGLETIADMGSDATYICEADLGFGGGITTTPAILGAVRQALGQAKVKTISLPAMTRLAKEWKNAGEVVTYPQADLSLWTSALMKGTAITAVAANTTADVFNGNPDTITGTTITATMSILNEDGSIDTEALALGLAELEGYITNGDIPMPIYCYSCQLAAFGGISCGVTPVEYKKGAFLSTVMVGVLPESPIKEESLSNWYYYLLDGLKGADEGMFNVADMSSQLFTNAFKAMGLPLELASYALSPLPLAWLQHGIILVVPGKNAKGLVDRHVSYEELIDEALLNVLVDRNVKIYTAVWTFDKTARKSIIKGVKTDVYRVESGYGVEALPDGMEGDSMLIMKDDNEFEFVNNNVIGMNISNKAIHTLDNYMQKHVLDILQYLIDSHGVEVAIQYMEAVLPNLVKKVKVASSGKVQYSLAVYNQQNAAEYYMEFTPEVGNLSRLSARHCTISSGRADRCVNAITNLSGFPDTIYDGVTVALGLAISAASGRKLTQDAFEGYLAGTTNLWARSENYGLELTTVQTPNYTLTDSLKVIIDNSGKTISSTRNQNVDAKGVSLGNEASARWPYHMPCNASLDLSVMASLMKKGELVLCDKYAMERIIIGDGARAMLASILSPEDAAKLNGYNETFGLEIALNPLNGNAVYTVCWPTDKASKALNRPSQFHGSSQADGWKEILTWCPLHTDLGNKNRSAIRGFKQTFIAAPTDFLSQGSGAASQHPDASVWSFKVNGSMRASLDWHQVPAVQEAVDANGNNLPGLRCHASIMGPDAFSGPAGKDLDGKEVPASKWFCDTFAQKWVGPAIEAAMYTDASKSEYRIYGPEEEMVVLFDKMYTKNGEKVGYYPNGNTAGLPPARTVLFSNNLGKQNCIITGYRLMPMQRGERLQVVLEYATVMDTRGPSDEWSGAKARGLGIKFIISHDATIDYLGGTAPLNGVETNLNDLYKAGAIHVTSEGLKGNYALMQGFAAAHGGAHESGPYLCVDQYLMDGSENPHYIHGDSNMVSDLTDTESYFYQWVRSNTRVIRMRKSVNEDVWNYIKACNRKALDKNGNLPGVEVVDQTPHAIQWDVDGGDTTDANTVTVEYDVQVLVFDYWVQVEVAPPGACTGNQGMTAEQASNLEVMLKDTSTRLWARGQNSRTGVENAVKSAETHTLVEAGKSVEGIFYFNPLNPSHNELMEQLLYQVSATGTRTLRPAKEFYLLLAAIFGGAATDTTALWTAMAAGEVSSISYVDGQVITSNEGYNYLKSVDGLAELVADALEYGYTGQGLVICTASEETGENTVTYVDPTVFLQLGAFESVLVAADPKTHAPARRVSGAATGIVNDIHKALLDWTTTQFWDRKGASSAVHGINSRLRSSMLGWIGVNSKQATMMNAKGVLGRIARIDGSAGVAGKVCTGIGPQYAHHVFTDEKGVEHKLPVAIMHPDCLLAKGLKHGDIVGVGRTPTVSLAFCVVKFSRTYGRIGYIHMGFNVWAAGNNGDTDGDPCNRIRVGGVTAKGKWAGATYAQAVKLNKHPLGMGGYEVVCGVDPVGHDCADFVSFKGVWTKKALNNKLIPAAIAEWAAESKLKIKDLEPLVNLMLPATLLDSAKKVSQHYRANVGVAYGWCSAYSAHMKEKHSFLEAVVTHLLTGELAKSYGAEAPTVDEMMEVLVSGEIYKELNKKVEVAATEPAPTEATPTQPDVYMEPDFEAIAAIEAKYPVIIALCASKLKAEKNPMNLVNMGQHIAVMLEASAQLWRGIYEGLGLSGYSPTASAFFEAFTIALRNGGKVGDASIKDDKGNVTLILAARPTEGKSVSIGEFLSTHYGMSLDAANEIFAACLLYNGYRAIERGQHLPGEDEEQLTSLETYTELYADTMSAWEDTKATEYIEHAVLAGVFRRAGQGTSGVSLNDEMSTLTSAQMIYTYAQELWSEKLNNGVAVFRNLMLNDIVVKSVTLYNKLVSIAGIDAEGDYYVD